MPQQPAAKQVAFSLLQGPEWSDGGAAAGGAVGRLAHQGGAAVRRRAGGGGDFCWMVSVVRASRLTKRLTIRISARLAEGLADAALRVDQDESAFVREILRRELLHHQHTGDGAPR